MTPVDISYTFPAPVTFIYPILAQKTCLFLPSSARTSEGRSRDAHMNRPMADQQRTSCHADTSRNVIFWK
ncbi:hypothetical protein Y032_0112g277 [Ancylostoma ceylanicum]|uniref:Uncharacterized protein n=1 Tax=Ancylostoma ceylanicum TaxID=53326 RepID=A0A016TDQ0_9BILA|nr:hypothetical protein Y032_0112g277 [Ancylostoma ceylanicum]